MKITIFFPCFFLMITGLFGQDYKPMLTKNSTWYEYIWFEGSATIVSRIGGDTIINQVSYKKLFVAENFDNPSFVFLREDTIEKKVYSLWSSSSSETLIYDFSLVEGDTFYVDDDNFITLDSITNYVIEPTNNELPDNPNLNIENPKVFYFTERWGGVIVWIEGIGSLSNLLSNDYPWNGGDYGETLLCHFNAYNRRDFHFIYEEEIAPCEGPILNIDNTHSNYKIKIFPNPFDNKLIIDFKNINMIRNIDVIIYNLNGQEQLSQTYNYSDNVTLNVEHLPKGFYLIKLLADNEQIYISKIIKQ